MLVILPPRAECLYSVFSLCILIRTMRLYLNPQPFLTENRKTFNQLEIDVDTLVQWTAPSVLI